MPRPLVCSIVLTYNNFADTDECLASLAAQTYERHVVIVVDNGSEDGSPAALKAKWGNEIRWVALTRNTGAAAGWNRGIEACLDEGAEYVLLCNNDISLDKKLIEKLVAAAIARPDMAILSPMISYYDRPGTLWFAGGSYWRHLGLTTHKGMNLEVGRKTEPGVVAPTDYVPTCAALVAREAIEAVGLFDERFFFGHEDVDWALRAARLGWSAGLLAEPLVRHKVSVTGGKRGSNVFTDFSAYHYGRGSMLVGLKHSRGLRLLTFVAGQLAVRLPYYSLQILRSGSVRPIGHYVRGLLAGLSTIRRVRREG
jgi:GT2 family glycosyltransferase